MNRDTGEIRKTTTFKDFEQMVLEAQKNGQQVDPLTNEEHDLMLPIPQEQRPAFWRALNKKRD